jgi:tRNA threonylcarbamoyl adenosine modification protein (Sua5/YciO/YrdC/YwlC family)
MFLKLYSENPNPKIINTVIECLRDGGVIIYPTDTVYGIGCDITKQKAVERIASIKGIKPEKSHFSFICSDLSHLSDYCKPISTPLYKIMKKVLPGPFTFLLNASNNVPRLFQGKKKTVGIRIPDNNIAISIVRELGNPIMSTSVHDEDEIIEYTTDPELIYEKYMGLVDIVIDGGYGGLVASTVLDCTTDEIKIIRQGKGILEGFI